MLAGHPMIQSISWTSIGDPAPQGSKRHVGRGIMIESSKKLPIWREQLINDIIAASNGITFDSGIQVTLIFKFPRLKAHFNSKGGLKSKAPAFKTTKPDIDKLCRAVLDAITLSGVIRDDALCFSIEAQKIYCNVGESPGVMGTITELSI